MEKNKRENWNLSISILRFYRKARNLISGMGFGRIFLVRFINDLIYRLLKPRGIVLINVDGNKMYVDANDKNIAPGLLTNDRDDKYEVELFKKTIKKGMVVVDIGANVGYYALIAAKLVGENGRVYAFEPEPQGYELISKSIEANGFKNIFAIKKIVSDRNGRAKLWFEKEWIGSPSLSESSVLRTSKHENLENGGFIEEEMITLDDFFENIVKDLRIDVIKMDVEGSEGLIIEGAKRILDKNKNLKIFTEFWPFGLKNLGTDPLKLIQKLQRDYGFKVNLFKWREYGMQPIDDGKVLIEGKIAKDFPIAHLFLEK